MKADLKQNERILFFLLGVIAVLSLFLLTGAAPHGHINTNGRYQISAWGTCFGENSGGCGAFVLDTMTGETRTAYSVIYGTPPQRSTLVNNLRKSFYSIP